MQILKTALFRLVPASILLGAATELFMIKTGFYHIVTIKEGDRLFAIQQEEERQLRRMRELKIEAFSEENMKQYNKK